MKIRMNVFFLLVTTFCLQHAKLLAIVWGAATTISDPAANSWDSSIAINNNLLHNGVAAWSTYDGSNMRIAVANFSLGSWGSPTNLSPAGFNCFEPKVVMNDNNHALAVWERKNGNIEVQASYYDGTNWSTPTTISAASDHTGDVLVAMNDSDHGIAIWEVSLSGGPVIEASFFDGTTWSAPETLSTGFAASLPYVSINDSDEAFAIWEEHDGTNFSVHIAFFDGATWSAATMISTNGVNSFNPKVKINSGGDAIAAWVAQISGHNVLQTSDFNTLLSTWGSPVDRSSASRNVDMYDLGYNDLDSASISWREFDGSVNIINARVRLLGVWTPITLVSNPLVSSSSPVMSMGNLNQIVLSFLSLNGLLNEVEALSFQGGAWQAVTSLSAGSSNSLLPAVALNNSGVAFASWSLITGVGEVRVSQGIIP